MNIPAFLKKFKHHQTYTQQLRSAFKLIKKLFEIKLVKIILVALAALVMLPIAIFVVLRPVPQNDIEYGTTYSDKYATEIGLNWQDAYIKILDDLGAKNLRLVVYWEDVEPKPDEYDFSKIKWLLDESEKRNVNVMLSVGRKVPRFPECFEPAWWEALRDGELKNNELYEFVGTTVQELKGYQSIKIWQVENEPFFPFGDCAPLSRKPIEKEIEIVRALDKRPILVQDSGEGGFWLPTYSLGDYLGISMYRKIWYDFWGVFLGRSIYFQYPLAHWTYKIKANLVGVPVDRIYVTELQGEPWGPGLNTKLSQYDKDMTMSRRDFIDTLSYAHNAGFKHYYIWGAEWWLWEKEHNNNPFYWDTAKALFKEQVLPKASE